MFGGCTSNTGLCTGLLGAGTGLGSCAAPPFRSSRVEFSRGCPADRPCCSEFGYCRLRQGERLLLLRYSDTCTGWIFHTINNTFTIDWEFGHFRDCNGVSNGASLAPQTLAREARAGTFRGNPAGLLGPRMKLR